MPTNEERREVAYNLRGNAQAHPDMSLILNVAFSDDALRPDDGSMEYTVTSHDAAMRLADLIEPEPERTCRMTQIGGDRVLAGWWECSECGPVYPPCKDEIARWALQRCPRCGARVVDE